VSKIIRCSPQESITSCSCYRHDHNNSVFHIFIFFDCLAHLDVKGRRNQQLVQISVFVYVFKTGSFRPLSFHRSSRSLEKFSQACGTCSFLKAFLRAHKTLQFYLDWENQRIRVRMLYKITDVRGNRFSNKLLHQIAFKLYKYSWHFCFVCFHSFVATL